MKKLYSIGEVSKIKEITIKTLRYYHKVGLLIPAYIDEQTGYRYYTIEQFIYIDILKGCRELGTSIAELQEIFSMNDVDELRLFFHRKKAEAQENIKKLQLIIESIDQVEEQIVYAENAVKHRDIQVSYFEEREVAFCKCEQTGQLKELLYFSNLDKLMKEEGLEDNLTIGMIFDVSDEGDYVPAFVFNGLYPNEKNKSNPHVKCLPAGHYLVMTYSDENENEQFEKLDQYIKQYDLMVEQVIEIELYHDIFDIQSYKCQIQVLIQETELDKLDK